MAARHMRQGLQGCIDAVLVLSSVIHDASACARKKDATIGEGGGGGRGGEEGSKFFMDGFSDQTLTRSGRTTGSRGSLV